MSSSRVLTQKHLQRLIQEASGQPRKPPELAPNQCQLFAYYKPGLTAGRYFVEARQVVVAEATAEQPARQALEIYNRKIAGSPDDTLIAQEFNVVAPQFSLDPKLVNSFYPPPGHQDEGRVLPHVVLSDPHFPWERYAGVSFEKPEDPDLDNFAAEGGKPLDRDGKVTDDPDEMVYRNLVPWVALLVFDPDELRVPTYAEARALGIPDENFASKVAGGGNDGNDGNGGGATPDMNRQPATGGFGMSVGHYFDKVPAHSRVDFESAIGENGVEEFKTSAERMQAIFPTKDLLLKLFADINSFKYLSHVRNINTVGFPNAGFGEEMGVYSIVVSGRTGKLEMTQPTPQICHLVSIEHLDSTIKGINRSDAKTLAGRIGLVSLFSWTYTALPPDPVNFVDSIRHVMEGMQMLRPLDATLEKLDLGIDSAGTDAQKKSLGALSRRLRNGYTMARWRAETGETTAAFSRGPLVPQPGQNPPVADWAFGSNTSKEYQILDPGSGLVDLSYSAAWQLGKVLAIADTAFSGALARFRSFVQTAAASRTRKDTNRVADRATLVRGLTADLGSLKGVVGGDVGEPRRVFVPPERRLAPVAMDDPAVAPAFRQNLAATVESATTTTTSSTPSSDGSNQVYNEFNEASNADWPVIHRWISEKLYLSDIPAHELIPDPAFLPEESIRFFHIDDAWLDCLLDGALSVANHLERDDDAVRAEIKRRYNAYLAAPVVDGIAPQVPCYGFLLRSQIVKVMPDLRITVAWSTPDKRQPFCRYTRPDDHTILCLLDRAPEELDAITLAQPPHQQRFSLGHAVDLAGKRPEIILRNLYTQNPQPEDDIEERPDGSIVMKNQPAGQPSAEEARSWFRWDDRMLNTALLAKGINEKIQMPPPAGSGPDAPGYVDFVPTSSELAMELNDPSYYFLIKPPLSPNPSPGPVPPPPVRVRQLRVTPFQDPIRGSPGDMPADPPDFSKPIGPPRQPPITKNKPPTTATPPRSDSTSLTRIVFRDSSPVPANSADLLKRGAVPSCFTMQVWADYKGVPRTWPAEGPFTFDEANYVPTQAPFLFDLVFSIRKRAQNARADHRLREILVNIPLDGGGGGAGAAREPLLAADYEGPGARMLANQRFTALINRTASFLQVRLVPRSAAVKSPAITINDRKTDEISFRLAEVDIAPVRKPLFLSMHGKNTKEGGLGLATVEYYERYEVGPNSVVTAFPVPGAVSVVKRPKVAQ